MKANEQIAREQDHITRTILYLRKYYKLHLNKDVGLVRVDDQQVNFRLWSVNTFINTILFDMLQTALASVIDFVTIIMHN